MLSNNKIKFIKSLKNKKYRDNSSKFIAEGDKLVADLLNFYPASIHEVFATSAWIAANPVPSTLQTLIHETDFTTLKKASLFNTASQVLAICTIPFYTWPATAPKISLFIDAVQDPGNLGTIFRTAAWFNVEALFYNADCADPFNPKTFRSSMGAVLEVPSFKTTIEKWRNAFPALPLIGAQMQGTALPSFQKPSSFTLALGNEGQGLSADTAQQLTSSVTIPKGNAVHTESLNVGTATAILLYALTH